MIKSLVLTLALLLSNSTAVKAEQQDLGDVQSISVIYTCVRTVSWIIVIYENGARFVHGSVVPDGLGKEYDDIVFKVYPPSNVCI